MPTFEPIADEVWRLLPDAEGRYEVSDLGRIRSLVAGSRSGTIPRKTPLLLTPHDNGRGYLIINIKLSSGYRCQGINSLVLLTFDGPRPTPIHQAAHLNGQRHDNRRSNLAWVTPKQNDSHKDAHGTRRLRPVRVVGGVECCRCTQCDTWLSRSEFRPLLRARSRSGISSWCRRCENARARERKRQLREKARPAQAEGQLATPTLPTQAADAGLALS